MSDRGMDTASREAPPFEDGPPPRRPASREGAAKIEVGTKMRGMLR
jgi:hypothetical protein